MTVMLVGVLGTTTVAPFWNAPMSGVASRLKPPWLNLELELGWPVLTAGELSAIAIAKAGATGVVSIGLPVCKCASRPAARWFVKLPRVASHLPVVPEK